MTPREKLVEVMAAAYVLSTAGSGWSTEHMEAALDAAEEAGAVMTPLEATGEMLDAGRNEYRRQLPYRTLCNVMVAKSPYRRKP